MQDSPVSETHFSNTCVFCQIIHGEEKAYIVFEDGISLAFLDSRPLFPNCDMYRSQRRADRLDQFDLLDLPPLIDMVNPFEIFADVLLPASQAIADELAHFMTMI